MFLQKEGLYYIVTAGLLFLLHVLSISAGLQLDTCSWWLKEDFKKNNCLNIIFYFDIDFIGIKLHYKQCVV